MIVFKENEDFDTWAAASRAMKGAGGDSPEAPEPEAQQKAASLEQFRTHQQIECFFLQRKHISISKHSITTIRGARSGL